MKGKDLTQVSHGQLNLLLSKCRESFMQNTLFTSSGNYLINSLIYII